MERSHKLAVVKREEVICFRSTGEFAAMCAIGTVDDATIM